MWSAMTSVTQVHNGGDVWSHAMTSVTRYIMEEMCGQP